MFNCLKRYFSKIFYITPRKKDTEPPSVNGGDFSIKVTCWDILYGRRAHNSFCPIARAAKRQYKTKKVDVSYYSIFCDEKYYIPSPEAERFMRDFDNFKLVWPQTFYFEERND